MFAIDLLTVLYMIGAPLAILAALALVIEFVTRR